jgi:hypothetical protein
MMSVAVEPGDPPRFGAPRPLFRLPRDFIEISPSRDGERFMVSTVDFGGLPPVHTVVMNWPETLHEK